MASETCRNCGTALKEKANFCTGCGAPRRVGERGIPVQVEGKPRRWLPWTLVGSGLILLIATIVLVTFWGKGSDQTKSQAGTQQQSPTVSSGQANPESKPITTIVEPSPTKPPVDLEASDRLNEEGLKKAQDGKFVEGGELFSKAIKANPNNAKAWNNLGLAMRKTGKLDEAVKAYRQAIQAQPDFALAYKNLGVALEQSGDKNGAVQAYLKYAQLDPSAPDRSDVQKRAEQLKK